MTPEEQKRAEDFDKLFDAQGFEYRNEVQISMENVMQYCDYMSADVKLKKARIEDLEAKILSFGAKLKGDDPLRYSLFNEFSEHFGIKADNHGKIKKP